jgi:N-methylhydantoinase A/oxoprolinase/acetone carboxylase beta subunit
MLRALRVVSVERGLDPGDLALIAFGGAGPLHACALAEELGCPRVIVPEAAGVLSALGLAVSDERRDTVRSEVRQLEDVRDLPSEGEADLRYRGQSFELTVPLGPDVAQSFHRAHEERYGYADPDGEVELVAIRTAEIRSGPRLELTARERREVSGPATVELPGATCFVPEGWVGATDTRGTLILEQG